MRLTEYKKATVDTVYIVTHEKITLLNIILTNQFQPTRLVIPSTDINTFHWTLKKTQLVEMPVTNNSFFRTSLIQTITIYINFSMLF